jgi:ABC-type Fe3+-hydroxamate transport system substrate-binding protein
MTESLFDLGLGDSVVGITDFCTHPADRVKGLTRVGGTKNPSVDAIAALKPDLILANQEENMPETVNALEGRGLKVWVSFPRTVRGSMDVLWTLVGIYQSKPAAIRLETLERALDWAEADKSSRTTWTYFCPIWQSEQPTPPDAHTWWMTFNQDTYMHDLLSLFGGVNIFGNRHRRYPLEADLGLCEAIDSEGRDTRYPRVSRQEVIAGNPQVILLPSEPFSYIEEHQLAFLDLFKDTPAAKDKKIICLDGSLLTWHGTRLGKALTELASVLNFN